jgi:membrane protease YdiL (CAAX protease family)
VNSTSTQVARGIGDLAAVVAVGLGLLFVAYGVLVLPSTLLGGGWLVAIGASFVLAGFFATEWAGRRLGLSTARRNTLSVGFAVLGIILLSAVVVINYVAFEPMVVEGGSSSGSN